MALTVKDRVRVVTTTTGTSDFVLGSAVAGYQNFSVIGDGNTTYYACSDSATGDWEVGVGTYSSSGPTLSRDTVLESSNSGSKVSFAAGSKDVFVTYPAERAVYLDTAGSAVTTLDVGTLGVSTANITTANITAGTVTTTPASGNDLVNKTYVDGLVASGIHFHQPVMVESPINLNATYNNGTAGVGATLTNAGTQVELIIDGIFTSPGDRVLVYNQTNPIENGIYVVTVVGTVSTNWVLTRASDADTYVINSANGLSEGSTVFVQLGATGAGETYTCNTSGVITFGTTAITFAQISSAQIYSAGTGLTLSGTQFSITNTGTAGTYGSASSVPVFTTNAQGQVTSVTNTAISITSAAVSGLAASATTDTTNAANITSGTLPSARINGSYTGLTGVGTLTAGTWNATTIGAAYGGTDQSSYTIGDILYANGSTSLAKLPDVATGNALISGGVGTAPSWGKIGLTTHVSGTLPVASGGTGATTLTGYVYGNGTGAMTASTSIPNSATTATSANTASAIVARDASGNFSAGTITASLSGNASTATSATSATTATNLAGGVAGAVPYQTGSGATSFSAAGSSGQYLQSNGTSAPTWITPPTIGNGTLTMNVSGTGLSGSQTFTANQSTNATFTVTSNATSANTASAIVARDASGNFSAGTITASLSGNASTATTASQVANTVTFNNGGAGAASGNGFNGSGALTVSYNTIGAPSTTGTNASGTWGINISGNAATATTATTASNSNLLNNLSSTQLFNNMGQNHSTYTDANAFTNFGTQFLQGTTNGPGAGGGQWYMIGMGLGNEYAYSSYAMQVAIPRTPVGGNPYVSVRFREGGTWNSWAKIYAGFADTAGTITSQANSATITASTAATANQIVLRDANGDDNRRYGFASYFNMSHGVSGATGDTIFYSSTDDYIRKNNATGFRASLNVPTRTGGDASGTWGINITGTASGNLVSGGALGTPSSGTATNLTGLPLTTGVTGTLPVANGGTGAATLTANNVLLGNGTSAVQVVAPSTAGNVLTSNGTTWTSAAAGGSIPSGTVMLFVQTAAPTGWTKSTTHDNKALRIVSGAASSGGSVAFTTAFASQTPVGTVGNTTLNTTQIPSHSHGVRGYSIGKGETLFQLAGGTYTGSTINTNSAGGGGSHNHSFTGTAINLAVQYVDVIIATKN